MIAPGYLSHNEELVDLLRIVESELATNEAYINHYQEVGKKLKTWFLCALGDCILDLLAEAAKSPKEEVRMHAEFTAVRYQEMKLEKEKRTVGGEGFEPPTSSV